MAPKQSTPQRRRSPVALIVAGTHFIENHTHNRDIQELAEGIEAGA